MNKYHGLFNIWTVLGTIFLGMAVLFQNFWGNLLTAIGLSFFTLALYFELDERFGKKFSYISILLGVTIWAGFFIVIYFQIPDSSNNEFQPKVVMDSSKINSDTLISKVKPSEIIKSDSTITNKQTTHEIEFQPYIRFVDVKIDSFEIGEKIHLSLFFKNMGKTPAIDLMVHSELYTGNRPTLEVFNYKKALEISKLTLPPNTKVSSRIISNDILTQEYYDHLIKNKLYYFVFGKLIYNDVFDKSHLSTYCVRIDFSTRQFIFNSTYNEDKLITEKDKLSIN